MNNYEEQYLKLDFTNDFLFCKIMSVDLDLCRKVLETILGISIREVRLAESQKAIGITGDGRGVRLDVYVNDENNTVYDIEMQRKFYPDMPKRTRYYRGMIDLNLIEKGDDFSALKKSIVIFICLTDPYKEKLYRYTFRSRCEEVPSLLLGDESEVVFLNASGEKGEVSEDLKEFLRYLKTGDVKTPLCKEIEKAVLDSKKHEEWRVEFMTLRMRDAEMRAEGREEGRAEGREEGRAEGREEGRAEGREEGRAEGREEGRAEGREEGRAEGRAEGVRAQVLLLKKLNVSFEEAFRLITSNPLYSKVSKEQVKLLFSE